MISNSYVAGIICHNCNAKLVYQQTEECACPDEDRCRVLGPTLFDGRHYSIVTRSL